MEAVFPEICKPIHDLNCGRKCPSLSSVSLKQGKAMPIAASTIWESYQDK